MHVTEYIIRKNEILYKLTGVILVPEDQIIEVPIHPLSDTSDAEACPYCLIYANGRYEKCSTDCPMKKKNNECNVGYDNTYTKIITTLNLGKKTLLVKVPEIKMLIEEFNKSNGFN